MSQHNIQYMAYVYWNYMAILLSLSEVVAKQEDFKSLSKLRYFTMLLGLISVFILPQGNLPCFFFFDWLIAIE